MRIREGSILNPPPLGLLSPAPFSLPSSCSLPATVVVVVVDQLDAVDVYGQGVARRVLHYPGVDLFKYQANYFVEQGAQFKTDL